MHSSIQLGHSEAYNTNKQMPERSEQDLTDHGKWLMTATLTSLHLNAPQRETESYRGMHFRVYFASLLEKQTSPKHTNSQQRTTTFLSPMCAVTSLKSDLTPIIIIFLTLEIEPLDLTEGGDTSRYNLNRFQSTILSNAKTIAWLSWWLIWTGYRLFLLWEVVEEKCDTLDKFVIRLTLHCKLRSLRVKHEPSLIDNSCDSVYSNHLINT